MTRIPPWRSRLAAAGLPDSPVFVAYNRDKRLIRLDLRSARGREKVLELVKDADVLIESARPGVMERLGLGADELLTRNPRLVYASVSGFGRGPVGARMGGVDIVVQAESGIISTTGYPDRPGTKVGFTVVDAACGHALCHGILAALGTLAYPPGAPTSARDEWRPADGRPPASSVALLQEHVLDPWRVDAAIVNCAYGVDSLRHPDWAPALARAVNDWLIAELLDRDPRLVASMVVPARDPVAAAAEIDRIGSHPRIVQVTMPVRSERLYGQRVFWPIYDAITRHDLVMGLSWGGTTEDAPSPTGYASWYAEEYAAEVQLYGSQLTSMVYEGVFRKFPGLRVTMLESGFAWVPTWTWSMNKKWKGLRREIPWVDRLPTEIVRDHFRFSIAPADLGPAAHSRKIIEWLGSEDLLLFATDYPHLHTDDLAAVLDVMPGSMRPKVMAEAARAWYRLGSATA